MIKRLTKEELFLHGLAYMVAVSYTHLDVYKRQRYVRKKQGGGNGAPRPEHSAEEEANDIVGFFQSKLE